MMIPESPVAPAVLPLKLIEEVLIGLFVLKISVLADVYPQGMLSARAAAPVTSSAARAVAHSETNDFRICGFLSLGKSENSKTILRFEHRLGVSPQGLP